MFIDDNTSATNRFRRWLHHPPMSANIVMHLQADDMRLLFTVCGLLKLRKCLYYAMSQDFYSEGHATLCSKEDTPSLRLTNGTDLSPKDINQHDCNDAQRYLGLWNSLSLSMKANLATLAAKSKAYSRRLFQSGLGKYEVWFAYFSCFVPAMIFTMAVTSFTAAQLMSLKKQANPPTLARLGFNSNISRNIVFGSPIFGCIGLRDLVLEQGIAQLELLLRHVRAGTPQGSLFLIGLSWWHLVAGFTASLWETTDSHMPYVERSW
jgi:hypothetical protein